MSLGDGDFHPSAHAEGSAVIALKNECLSAAMLKVLELWEDVLARRRTLEKDFVYRVTVDGCELFTRGLCTLTCNEGISIAVGRIAERRVVLAISSFDDLSLEAVYSSAGLDAGRPAVPRIRDL